MTVRTNKYITVFKQVPTDPWHIFLKKKIPNCWWLYSNQKRFRSPVLNHESCPHYCSCYWNLLSQYQFSFYVQQEVCYIGEIFNLIFLKWSNFALYKPRRYLANWRFCGCICLIQLCKYCKLHKKHYILLF